ncbi:sensor histidine kinase [Azospirillum sp. ST 5-10]|uniref:sensor histidine kinase n=1 Tax=unclassified Azospirillum TaxID=2630922 RepID=UPI003F4A4B0F
MSVSPDGAVLVCDRDGRVREVHGVGAGVPGLAGRRDVPFPVLFGLEPFGRALDLFAALRRDGVVTDWPLDVRLNGAERPLYVSGRALGSTIVLAACEGPACADRLCEALSHDRPDLAAVLGALRDAPPAPPMAALFEEMARLNSQLATTQRELAKANAELAASNEQKSRLLGMLAHDLRTPLQVIAGFAWMLVRRLKGRVEERDLAGLERIRESSQFMRHLIEDVLSLSALQAGRLTLSRRPVDIGALVRGNVDGNEILALGRGVVIDCTVAAGLPPVPIDPPRIEQVMNNLLSNAVKFSDAGGRVAVTVERAGGGVRVAVADQGKGIPADEMDHLFQPFSRTSVKASAGDSSVGLGLFICRSIVEAHGGTIAAESAPGRGSTFAFELPADGRDAA